MKKIFYITLFSFIGTSFSSDLLYGSTQDSLLLFLRKTKVDSTKINIYLSLGDNKKSTNIDSSIYFYLYAAQLAENLLSKNNTVQNKELLAKSFLSLGIAYRFSEDYKKGIEYYQKALLLYKETQNSKQISQCYNSIGVAFYYLGEYSKAEEYYKLSLKICQELKFKDGILYCYANLGNINSDRGNLKAALLYFQKALEIAKATDNKNKIAACFNNLGIVYSRQGNYHSAVENYIKSLNISEKLKDYNTMSSTYNNLASVYYAIKNYEKALNYYSKSLNICKQNGFENQLSDCYTNMGNVYKDQGLFDTSLYYFNQSIIIAEKLEDKNGLSIAYSNKGTLLAEYKKYTEAMEYYKKSLLLDFENGDTTGIATNYVNLAAINIFLADSTSLTMQQNLRYLNESVKYGTKAFELAKMMGTLPLENDAAFYLYRSLLKLGNKNEALKYANIYITLRDSLFDIEKNTALFEIESKYQFEKNELEIEKLLNEKALQNETIARKDAENHKKSIIIYFLIGVFIIILFFSVIIYRLFLQKKKANILLAIQKSEIEEKNEELNQQNEEISSQRDEIEQQRDTVLFQKSIIENIHKEQTDSIHYAKQIQNAILPNFEILEKYKIQHFILYKPKNIVSGDFYWITEIDSRLIFCVADCTGHGVPGAFMSMLGISLLNEIVKKERICVASQILNNLRESVINSLQQHGISGEQKDGMDISLCVLDTNNNLLQFAGANNPIYIVKSQKSEVKSETSEPVKLSAFQLEELKGNKMPLSIYPKMESFQDTEIHLQRGDTIYLFSDGYADQFGGESGKKFMYKQFKELLLANSQKDLSEQQYILENEIVKWIGNKVQIDDITVFGLRI